MTYCVARSDVEGFYNAYAARNASNVARYLDDNVEWTISGPVDLLPFCGKRYGKAAVLELIEKTVPDVFRVHSFVPDSMVIDGDQVATLNRLSAKCSSDGRVITYRLAHFMKWRDGKVVQNLSLLDSFDAVEQVLGHPLAASQGRSAASGNVVAL